MRGIFLKKGANFDYLINILGVLDADFNVDYDFVIKHDLILWCYWLMGIQSCKNSGDMGSRVGSVEFIAESRIGVKEALLII